MTAAIVQAASKHSVLQAALAYRDLGISVLPVRGKEPALNWRKYQFARATTSEIVGWDERGLLQGVGVICGKVSGLVVVDLDGDKAVEAFKIRFPDMLDTYTVRSGSGHGLHLYYRPAYIPANTRVVGTPYGNFELRSDGCYVVAPPSLHPSGGVYRIENRAPVMIVNHLRPIQEWIKGLMAEKHGGKLPPPSRPQGGTIRNATAYGRAALAGECAKVRAARDGRNNTLFKAALCLGNLVADGHLHRAEVERALLDAAAHLSATDGEGGTIRTINSGLNRGIENGMSGRKQQS